MMQEIAFDKKERVQKKLKTSAVTSNNEDRPVLSDSNVEGYEPELTRSIWQSWKEFLENAHKQQLSYPFQHGAVWYGAELHRRSSLPKNLYTRMKYETTAMKQYKINNKYKQAIKNIIQTTTRNDMLEYC